MGLFFRLVSPYYNRTQPIRSQRLNPRSRKLRVAARLKRPKSVTFINTTRTEVKYIGSVLTGNFASVSTAGALQDLGTNIAEGSEMNQRVGRTITLRSLDVFGTLLGGQVNLVGDDSHNTVRIVVFEGQPGLVAAGINWTLNTVADPRTINGCSRILSDRFYKLVSPGRDSTGYVPAEQLVKFSVPLSGQMIFSGAAAGTQSGRTIYMYMVTDSAGVPNPGFSTGVASLSWYDY